MPKISIIVPVYKTEKYLHRCLDSIVAQTYTDWECILVDDGSPDNSGMICDEYAEMDSRFRVFHQENKGVSAARNKGLDEANGEWIGFVDSDDWISQDYFHIDYLQSDIIQKRVASRKNFNQKVLKKEQYLFFFVNQRTNFIYDKIINRKIIENQRFDASVKVGEDFLFLLALTPKISVYSFSNKGQYFYNMENSTSAMHSIEDAEKRMKIIESNIHNVKKYAKEPLYFQDSIIYKSYLPFFFHNKTILTKSQKVLLSDLLNDFDLKKLKYVSFANKLKLYYFKLKLHLFSK